ncbi:MAG: hypothetical protein D6820_14790 [Lentisphaerae bacterium]|nr:MAG: hypothetical protein D6820_14790 [Lentisphaerota bacterium]
MYKFFPTHAYTFSNRKNQANPQKTDAGDRFQQTRPNALADEDVILASRCGCPCGRVEQL